MARRATRKPTLRELRAEAYRAAIRRGAERVFAARGFAGAHVGQIAKEAGVSVGTIYRTYPGRKRQIYEDLQAERGREVIEHTHARGLAAFQRRGDVLEAILEGIEALVEYFIAHPDYLRIILCEERAWALPLRQTKMQAANWKKGIAGSEEAMRQGISAGLLVDDVPEVMARTLVSMQQAHLGYWLEAGGRAPASEVVARLRRQFLRAFCLPEVAARHLGDASPQVAAPSERKRR